MDMILDSPIAVTEQLIKSSSGEGVLSTQGVEMWMNEQSRDELSDLLVAAEGLIKTRESGASHSLPFSPSAPLLKR